MTRFRFSTRGLVVAIAVVGFDFAVMTGAYRFARANQSGIEIVYGFALVLLFLHVVVFFLCRSFARNAGLTRINRLNSTPSPLMIFGLYAAFLAFVILSVLLISNSGRF